ncbi:MAG TPA: hypothetical protein VF043_08955 [Ktedonobacteraceae bacterium]
MSKGVQRHPASIWGAHYFTRNRTRGSDFPPFSPCIGDPNHRFPLLSRAFLATGKVLLFVVGRVRFLVKPTFLGAGGLLA